MTPTDVFAALGQSFFSVGQGSGELVLAGFGGGRLSVSHRGLPGSGDQFSAACYTRSEQRSCDYCTWVHSGRSQFTQLFVPGVDCDTRSDLWFGNAGLWERVGGIGSGMGSWEAKASLADLRTGRCRRVGKDCMRLALLGCSVSLVCSASGIYLCECCMIVPQRLTLYHAHVKINHLFYQRTHIIRRGRVLRF